MFVRVFAAYSFNAASRTTPQSPEHTPSFVLWTMIVIVLDKDTRIMNYGFQHTHINTSLRQSRMHVRGYMRARGMRAWST